MIQSSKHLHSVGNRLPFDTKYLPIWKPTLREVKQIAQGCSREQLPGLELPGLRESPRLFKMPQEFPGTRRHSHKDTGLDDHCG